MGSNHGKEHVRGGHEKELEALSAHKEHTVAKLNHEGPGSGEHRFEARILKDAQELLAEKRRKPRMKPLRIGMNQFMTTWHISKTDGDSYHVYGGDQFTNVNENVDGPKLIGMLTAKGLSIPDAMATVFSMDEKGIGFQQTIVFRPAPFGEGAAELKPPFEHTAGPEGNGCAEGCAACQWLDDQAQMLGG